MTITTKFNVGDKVFTIDPNTIKIKDFVVKRVLTCTSAGNTSVTLYDGDSYPANGYNESTCFATEADLITFITSRDDAKTL